MYREWINTSDKLPSHEKSVLIPFGDKEIKARYCKICNVFETEGSEDIIYSDKWKDIEEQQCKPNNAKIAEE